MSEPMSPESDVCPQCGGDADWSTSSWCESCGFYPAIGQFVGSPETDSEEEVIYENWWEAVPSWLWVLIGGVIGIFITSIGVRLLFEESPVRLWWTVVQLAVGFVAFFVSHLLAYLYAAPNSDRIGPMDAFIKPIATWQPVLRTLPEKIHLLWTVTWGLTAFVTAFFVIDGIDYQAVADSYQQVGEEEPKKKINTIAAIVRTAKTASKVRKHLPKSEMDAESLGEALTEFTGAEAGTEEFSAMVTDEQGDGRPKEQQASGATESRGTEADPAEKTGKTSENGQRESADTSLSDDTDPSSADSPDAGVFSDEIMRLSESIECLVVGYTTNVKGEPRSLLLAALLHNRLKFVAKVSLERVQPEALAGLEKRFLILRQGWPVVSSPYGGHWLKPKLFCQVRFSHWTGNGRLDDPFVTEFAMATKPGPHDASVVAP